ncbi:uncharacterized protein MJAP1_001839 [Malassezia japonica]|uniref:Conserved oligomeric Golgi complex subunit 5 helical domain-containing protein n=1 Tax=Malassezia japonica TaxID=223818 RepID=A0AAF0F1U5_9BASI|nr:uncharacterized protein MJAP1_001839 [Malassezia japonica]WFD38874.1 hypothetical protein MJAP1_001839 [Malassezia japonica]
MDTSGSQLPPEQQGRSRRKWREKHINNAYETQKSGAIRGAVVWSVVGATGVFMAHHIFPGFKRQTLALKGLLTISAASIGLVFGAENALLRYEHGQRSHDNLELEELVYAPPDEDEVGRELRTECAQLEFVGPHLTWLPDAAQILQEQIENLLLCGLRHLSPMLLGMALQAAEHRGMLPEVVRNLLDDLSDVLLERIRAALDLYAIGKTLGEAQPPLLPPRTLSAIYHHQPDASASHPHAAEQIQRWTSAIWERIHSLVVDEMAPIFTKVHMLEHVLHLKHEPTSGTTFLEVVSKVPESVCLG